MKKHWYRMLAALCLLPFFCACLPEDDPPYEFDTDLLPGKWLLDDSMLYYRYNEDGTGCTWDEADDITEDEAQPFTWEVDGNQMIHLHITETGTAQVPKYYILTQLTDSRLCYHDAYVSTKTFSLTKVVE